MELFEKGLITTADTDGLSLEWGNLEAVESLFKKIAFREGFGHVLAEGARGLAQSIGPEAERYAVQGKGLEITAVDQRGTAPYALDFAVSSRGADHLNSEIMCQFGNTPELVKIANRLAGNKDGAKPLVPTGKAKMVKWHEEVVSLSDSLGICFFHTLSSYRVDPKTMAELFSSGTGIELTFKELLKCGERVINLERAINLREGFTPDMDTLPLRVTEDAIADGPAKGLNLPRRVLKEMVEDYYKIRGWDLKTGIPTSRKLRELGLDYLIS